MIDVNIRGVLHGIAAALPVFRAAGSGHFVNVSSISGLQVAPTTAVYSGTKFAVRAISEGLRQEAGSKIRATTICPGAVETELAETISNPDLKKRINAFQAIAFHPRPLPARSHLPSSSRGYRRQRNRGSAHRTADIGTHSRSRRQGPALIRSFLTVLSGMKLPEAQIFFGREIERVGDLLAWRAFKVRLASLSFLPCSERTSMRATGDWSRPSNMLAG